MHLLMCARRSTNLDPHSRPPALSVSYCLPDAHLLKQLQLKLACITDCCHSSSCRTSRLFATISLPRWCLGRLLKDSMSSDLLALRCLNAAECTAHPWVVFACFLSSAG